MDLIQEYEGLLKNISIIEVLPGLFDFSISEEVIKGIAPENLERIRRTRYVARLLENGSVEILWKDYCNNSSGSCIQDYNIVLSNVKKGYWIINKSKET